MAYIDDLAARYQLNPQIYRSQYDTKYRQLGPTDYRANALNEEKALTDANLIGNKLTKKKAAQYIYNLSPASKVARNLQVASIMNQYGQVPGVQNASVAPGIDQASRAYRETRDQGRSNLAQRGMFYGGARNQFEKELGARYGSSVLDVENKGQGQANQLRQNLIEQLYNITSADFATERGLGQAELGQLANQIQLHNYKIGGVGDIAQGVARIIEMAASGGSLDTGDTVGEEYGSGNNAGITMSKQGGGESPMGPGSGAGTGTAMNSLGYGSSGVGDYGAGMSGGFGGGW